MFVLIPIYGLSNKEASWHFLHALPPFPKIPSPELTLAPSCLPYKVKERARKYPSPSPHSLKNPLRF